MTKYDHAMRRADKELELASLVMSLCDKSGVSLSPSTVRHRLAVVFGSELSQRSVDRLVTRLRDVADTE